MGYAIAEAAIKTGRKMFTLVSGPVALEKSKQSEYGRRGISERYGKSRYWNTLKTPIS